MNALVLKAPGMKPKLFHDHSLECAKLDAHPNHGKDEKSNRRQRPILSAGIDRVTPAPYINLMRSSLPWILILLSGWFSLEALIYAEQREPSQTRRRITLDDLKDAGCGHLIYLGRLRFRSQKNGRFL